MNLDINKPIQLSAIGIFLLAALFVSINGVQNSQNVEDVSSSEAKQETIESKEARYDRAKPITNPSGFINAENVSIEENIGDKVILLDMWTYSCINCQRTLPHLKEWDRKYRDDGLLIIGNHAPEFEFEKKRSNVEDAAERFNITYPIVLDNNYGTWRAYNNRYWPQKYLIGIDGFIRYEHIGEGAYDKTEQKIVELLKERKERLGIDSEVDEDGVKELEDYQLDTSDVNTQKVETPEIYFGAWRNGRFANGPQETRGQFDLSTPENLENDRFYLDGEWSIRRKYAETSQQNASIQISYKAKNTNMVLDGKDAVVKVYQDGEPVGELGGSSVQNSTLRVDSEKLYKIVQNKGYRRHKLELELVEGELQAYTFTFG